MFLLHIFCAMMMQQIAAQQSATQIVPHAAHLLKTGFYADIIAVPRNPLEDISVVERVSFVMKGGAVVRQ